MAACRFEYMRQLTSAGVPDHLSEVCHKSFAEYEMGCRGYEGDGSSCNANQKAIDELKSVFWSQPDGLACDAGDDVEWPLHGPGKLAIGCRCRPLRES